MLKLSSKIATQFSRCALQLTANRSPQSQLDVMLPIWNGLQCPSSCQRDGVAFSRLCMQACGYRPKARCAKFWSIRFWPMFATLQTRFGRLQRKVQRPPSFGDDDHVALDLACSTQIFALSVHCPISPFHASTYLPKGTGRSCATAPQKKHSKDRARSVRSGMTHSRCPLCDRGFQATFKMCISGSWRIAGGWREIWIFVKSCSCLLPTM